jgi:hypothetical protein
MKQVTALSYLLEPVLPAQRWRKKAKCEGMWASNYRCEWTDEGGKGQFRI